MGELIKSIRPNFVELNELAGDANGGKVVFATDDYFAVAENMLKTTDPIFIPDKYTSSGKWMDGWETRRKRISGHDWCIVKLGAPCTINGICIDTAFFTGNFAPRVSVQGIKLTEREEAMLPQRFSKLGSARTAEHMEQVSKVRSELWPEIVPMIKLGSGYEQTRMNYISVDSNEVCSHLRINIYPDGGIARFRVYGQVEPNLHVLSEEQIFDLIALENGGTCVGYSNAHYGHPRNMIKPGRGINMGDGWETGRRLDRPAILETDEKGILMVPGSEWVIIKMSCLGYVDNIVVDTNHFKGNFPDCVRIEGTILQTEETLHSAKWSTLLPNQKLSAHREHYYKSEISHDGPYNYLKITMCPDGGISRVRVYGTMAHDAF